MLKCELTINGSNIPTWSRLWSGRRPQARARYRVGELAEGSGLSDWIRHVLLPILGGYPQELHHDIGLLLGVLQNDVILRVGGVAHYGGAKDLGQAGEGHLVAVALLGHPPEVQDEEGQRVLVGGGELGNGLQGGCTAVFTSLTF